VFAENIFLDLSFSVRNIAEALNPSTGFIAEILRSRAILRYAQFVAVKYTSGEVLSKIKKQGDIEKFAAEMEGLTDDLASSARTIDQEARRHIFKYPFYRVFVLRLFKKVIEDFDDLAAFSSAYANEGKPGELMSAEQILEQLHEQGPF
jgi:hypothetical protein